MINNNHKTMNLDVLLNPISLDFPSGPDLEYDPEFLALEQESLGKPERQTGQTTIPAEEPNWPEIMHRAEAFFLRTKDLRVAVLFTRSLAICQGLEGLAFGLKLLHSLLTTYWDTVHPALDPEEGPATRLNVLAALGNTDTLLRDVRNIRFVSTGSHARLSVRDVLIATSKLRVNNSTGVPTLAEIGEILRLPENAPSIPALRTALMAVDEIHTFLGEKVGYDMIPDLQPLRDMLNTVVQLIPADSETKETPTNIEATAIAPASEEKGFTMPAPGEIRSREEAVKLLEKICEFLEKTEPSNPAPLFIRRGQRLMTKNFVEIMQELAPETLNNIRQITGIEPNKP